MWKFDYILQLYSSGLWSFWNQLTYAKVWTYLFWINPCYLTYKQTIKNRKESRGAPSQISFPHWPGLPVNWFTRHHPPFSGLCVFFASGGVAQWPSHVLLSVHHGLQHARPLCPSSSLKVCPTLCPFHWWCHPAISSSDTLFSFCPQSFPASGTFPMSQLFASND